MVDSCGEVCAAGEMSPTLTSCIEHAGVAQKGSKTVECGMSLAVSSGKHVHLPLVKKLPFILIPCWPRVEETDVIQTATGRQLNTSQRCS